MFLLPRRLSHWPNNSQNDQLLFYFCLYLKGRERKRSSVHCFTPQMLATARCGPGWPQRQRERECMREKPCSRIHWFTPQMSPTGGTRPGESQGPGTPSGSPVCVAGIWVLFCCPSGCTLAESWIGSQGEGTQTIYSDLGCRYLKPESQGPKQMRDFFFFKPYSERRGREIAQKFKN